MREKISAIFNTRAFYIVFSLIASIALWAYVGYGQNSDEEVRVNNVGIQYINADKLTEKDLVVTGRDQTMINLRFAGKRNTVSRLNKNNISVVVDLGDIVAHSASTGSYQLTYTIEYPDEVNESEITVAYSSVDFVTVTVEQLVTRRLSIDAVYDGGPAQGFSAEPVELSSDYVEVSGPYSKISQVDKVEARFTAYEFSSAVIQEVELTLLDEKGEKLERDGITLSQESVTATIPVVMVKEVRLDVTFTSSNSVSGSNLVYKLEPSSITLSGDADVLRDVNVLNLGTIDLNSFTQNYSETLSIRIPNGARNLTGVNSAMLTVNLKDVEITRMSITNISTRNETPNLYYKIITQSLDVTLRGSAASIGEVAENNVWIIADLSEQGNSVGTFSVTAKVRVDGFPDVDAIGPYRVTVQISDTPFPEEQETDENQSEQGEPPEDESSQKT